MNLDLTKLTAEQLDQLKQSILPRWTPYMTSVPTPKQQAFLALTCQDGFYGGSAGGG